MKEMIALELRGRLSRDLAAHERKVHELIEAHAAGQLESELALRCVALELHSVKGVASVLGMTQVSRLVGGLCEALMQRTHVPGSFWHDFHSWFRGLIACVEACADGGVEDGMLHTLSVRKEQLLTVLGKEPGERPQRRRSEPGDQLSPSAGRRILFVDDSATVRAAMTAKLGDRGYPVRAAKNLAETARLLGEFDPEIVVTDVHMPEVEGDDLCKRIKQQMNRVVPVILYSGLPDEELRARANAASADAHVSKLQGIEGLIEAMDELLSNEILL
jgi:CheY-like chemotaxis protein